MSDKQSRPGAENPGKEKLFEQVSGLKDDAAEFVQENAKAQKERAADQIDEVAEQLHETSEKLSEGQGELVADLVARGADELGSLAVTLRKNDLNALTERLQTMAHEQPAMFTGLSMAAGFAAVRLARVAGRRTVRSATRGRI